MARQVSGYSNSTEINNLITISATNHNGNKFHPNIDFDVNPPTEPPPPVPSSPANSSSLLTADGKEERSNQSRSVTPISELIQKFTAELQNSKICTQCENYKQCNGRSPSVSSSQEVENIQNVLEEHGEISQTLEHVTSLDHASGTVETNQSSCMHQNSASIITNGSSSTKTPWELAPIIRLGSVTDATSTKSLKENGTLSRKTLQCDSYPIPDEILDLNTNFVFQRQPSLQDSEHVETYKRVFIPHYEKRRASSASLNEISSPNLHKTNTNKDKEDNQIKQLLQTTVSDSDSRGDEPAYSIVFPSLEIPEELSKTSTKTGSSSSQLHRAAKHKLRSKSSSSAYFQQPLNASATAVKSETENVNAKWKHTVHPMLSQRFYTPQPVRKTYAHGTQHRSKMSSIPVKSLVTKFTENKHQ